MRTRGKKWLSALLALVMALSLFPAALAVAPGLANFVQVKEGDEFSDVKDGKWYAADVRRANQLDLMNGMKNNVWFLNDMQFKPNDQISIAETVTMAYRIHNIYHTGEWSIPSSGGGKWYQGYVDYAINNGIITAGQYSDYGAQATRAQFAVILCAALPEEALPAINNVERGDIPDVPVTADYAPAVYRLYNAGVLTGGDGYGTFTPDNTITRAECAALVTRLVEPSRRKTLSLTPSPAVPLYADDGSLTEVKPGLVAEYEAQGWHRETMVTMYALDGRTKEVRQRNVAAEQTVGWYLHTDYTIVRAESWAQEGDYSSAVLLVQIEKLNAQLNNDQTAYSALQAKDLELRARWQSSMGGCPLRVHDNTISITYNSIGIPVVNVSLWNISNKDIRSFEIKWTCVDAYGNVTTDWPTIHDGTFVGYMEREILKADSVNTFNWTMNSNERTASVRNVQVVRVAYTDGTVWQR